MHIRTQILPHTVQCAIQPLQGGRHTAFTIFSIALNPPFFGAISLPVVVPVSMASLLYARAKSDQEKADGTAGVVGLRAGDGGGVGNAPGRTRLV